MSPILGIWASAQQFPNATSFDSIASASGTGSSSTITFSSIPSTYKHLQIRVLSKETNAGTGITNGYIRINGATSGYSDHYLQGTGSTIYVGADTNSDRINLYEMTPDAGNTNICGVAIIDILDYSLTTKNKTVRTLFGTDLNGNGRIGLGSGAYLSTSAVTSVTIGTSTNFATTTQIALYGVKG